MGSCLPSKDQRQAGGGGVTLESGGRALPPSSALIPVVPAAAANLDFTAAAARRCPLGGRSGGSGRPAGTPGLAASGPDPAVARRRCPRAISSRAADTALGPRRPPRLPGRPPSFIQTNARQTPPRRNQPPGHDPAPGPDVRRGLREKRKERRRALEEGLERRSCSVGRLG